MCVTPPTTGSYELHDDDPGARTPNVSRYLARGYRKLVFTLRADRASPRVRSTPMPRVLVVEDDADILAAITEALTEEGWDVVPAPTAIEAMSAAQSAAVDVVLCDVLLDD